MFIGESLPGLASTQLGWVSRADAEVLLLSLRKVEDVVAYCAQYEFEDVIASVLDTDMAAPRTLGPVELSRKAYKLVRYLSGSRGLAGAAVAPLLRPLLDKDYDLFLPIFSHPHQLFALSCIPEWRKRCRKAVCYIVEAWAHMLPGYLLELLSDFDHVFINAQHVLAPHSKMIGRPCSYMPQGVDALRFSPWPAPPPRTIDV